MYVVINSTDPEREPGQSTVEIIADAIEEALDQGFETSDAIAQYLCTSSFRHLTDRRIKYNSALKASDLAGAHLTAKLVNAYLDLVAMAEDTEDAEEQASILAEAQGWAGAISVVLHPFEVEDSKKSQEVNWEAIDQLTEEFMKTAEKPVQKK